mmetsp:Transcript_30327/g.66367  ORF Transcript_30327/g.66367 Transcript_30327/m.66367 type:complete len:226 (+) Transcript_30327:29-706(+)|eukprot:CAMPEP_0170607480 /NCGR_PEP_ID=MMETSP0224-20130122/21078_1 /TAXON_ID=285029 /ORGANISM="Togula jolla, Strain CCCM 725" /LENGTH=225 /DNA_ID=CAMNT_0010932651 /DNA_START=24 /DNA_END=701 /DNA_ORIENTATION=-
MPGVLSLVASAVVVTFALGVWKVVGFARKVQTYRHTAKSGAQDAPPGFRILGATAQRAQELQWFVIDDQVMGGRSQSALDMSEGKIKFAGVINTTGGGFSNCRTLGDSEPLGIPSTAKAMAVTAIGDGRQYKLTLHTADSWAMSVPAWAHDFWTNPPGQRQTFQLPLDKFVPSKQGRALQGLTLDPSEVTGVGLSLSLKTMDGRPNPHFGDGPFSLTLEGLEVIP